MNFIPEDQSQDFANPGDGLQPVQRLGVVLFRRVDDGEFQVIDATERAYRRSQEDAKQREHYSGTKKA